MNSLVANTESEKIFSALLDIIIPPHPERGFPGGSQVNLKLEEWILDGLERCNAKSYEHFGKSFHLLSHAEQLSLIQRLRPSFMQFFIRLSKSLAECYYQNSQVVQAIGLDDRPPFPDGYRVEEGDLSLLEPVYMKGRIYRTI